ncbi:Major Facilitator Superfamily (MFS) [Thraustotheca clavata]|uniref:Major Facilitator Superfamily (MFS) n=1 Tax=Thraustotheca clavata TaxID=74557 RepID=A0A1W0A9F1_9STRA|nr:Major Facilitator Superfamily (MFS) [Thraustotheca clavata]
MGFKLHNITHIFALLCAINLLNYVDRGIIPGAPVQFQLFVQETYNVKPENVSFYIGVLVSAFIASYSVFICIFGYMSMTHRPFLLSAIGLFVWVLSIVLCGLAKPLNNFIVLLIGRLLSGIGESSFHATSPPFIDEFAPPEKRTLWLGIFYAGLSAGTAVGYSYGSVTAQTIGWDIGFYITAAIMFPMAWACWKWIPAQYDMPMGHAPLKEQDIEDELLNTHYQEPEHTRPTIFGEIFDILRCPLFLTSSLGLASYSFTLAGMGAFAPAILIGHGILSESVASTVFGALAVVAGLIGSPLGGWLVDRSCRGYDGDDAYRCKTAAFQMFIMMTSGLAFLFASLIFIETKIIFFICFGIGLLLMFSTQPATTIVIILSVTRARRGFAMGLNTLLLHLFGDVPSPMILGALKDMWAPHCGSVVVDNSPKLDPKCSMDKAGLQKTLAFAYGWLAWACLLWGIAYLIARKREKEARNARDTTPVVQIY